MKKYKVIVESRGKVIFFRNRKVRSPFTLEISESEINLLKSTMVAGAVKDYKIEEITADGDEEESWEKIILDTPKEETVIEELIEEEEPKTLLDKLLRDDKNGE